MYILLDTDFVSTQTGALTSCTILMIVQALRGEFTEEGFSKQRTQSTHILGLLEPPWAQGILPGGSEKDPP